MHSIPRSTGTGYPLGAEALGENRTGRPLPSWATVWMGEGIGKGANMCDHGRWHTCYEENKGGAEGGVQGQPRRYRQQRCVGGELRKEQPLRRP